MADSDHELRERIMSIIKMDKTVAKCNCALLKESLKLRDHKPGENVLILSNVTQRVCHQVFDFKRKDYLNCGGKESRFFNLYYGHHLMGNRDEETFVMEGLKLYQMHLCLLSLLKKEKLLLPPFTYEDFMNGVLDPLFYKLGEKPPSTSPQDYCRMRAYQTHKNLECVNLLFMDFRRRLLETLEIDDLLTCNLMSARQKLRDLFRNCRQLRTDQFIHYFYNIPGIAPGSLTQKNREFYRLFCKFAKGKDSCHILSPAEYQAFLDNLGKGKISDTLICYWALRRFMKWLTDVLDGKTGLHDTPFCDLSLLFEQIFERALAKARELIARFKANHPSATLSRKQYIRILTQELRNLGEEYNLLDDPMYYQLLLVKENTKTYFLDNCFLDDDMEMQSCRLRKAIVLNEMNKFFKSELSRIDERLVRPRFDIAKNKGHFADIISAMLPDQEVSEQFWRACKRIGLDLAARKPHYYLEEDFKIATKDIYNKASDLLSQRLDAQPDSVVIAYVTSQLKQLEIMALKSSDFEPFINDFLSRLIRLFEIKLKYASPNHCNNLSQIGLLGQEVQKQDFDPKPNPNPKPKPPKLVAFNLKGVKDESYGLAREDLVDLGAISKDTTTPHFRAAINGKEHAKPLVWLAAQGDLVTFIKELNRIMGPEFAPYNQHLNIASIWFVQKGGIPFDPKKLRLSKPTAREKEFIEAAQKIQKKDKKYVV